MANALAAFALNLVMHFSLLLIMRALASQAAGPKPPRLISLQSMVDDTQDGAAVVTGAVAAVAVSWTIPNKQLLPISTGARHLNSRQRSRRAAKAMTCLWTLSGARWLARGHECAV